MLRYGFAVFFVGIMAVAAGHTSTAAADTRSPSAKTSCPSSRRIASRAIGRARSRRCRSLTFRRRVRGRARSRPRSKAGRCRRGSPIRSTAVCQRSVALAERHRDDREVGRQRARRKGDPKDAPPPIEWPADGWQIKPDVVVRGPEFRVPAQTPKDVVEWTTYRVPERLHEGHVDHVARDQAERARRSRITSASRSSRTGPTRSTTSRTGRSRRATTRVRRSRRSDAAGAVARRAQSAPGRQPGADVGGGFNCYVPGRAADDYRPFGAGKLIPANSDISFQVHYTPIGKEIVDRPLIGFTVADKAPAKRWMSYGIVGGGPNFAIPPNDANYKSPPFDLEFTADVELVELMPHMHVRGKDMTYHLVYPDGRDQVVLNVPKYDFNWQILYQPAKPIRVPKGTRMYVDAHLRQLQRRTSPIRIRDRTVYLGRMTWEEMMAPFFGVLIDSNVDPNQVLKLGRFAVQGDGA